MVERQNNYQIQVMQAKCRFLTYDQQELIYRCGLQFDNDYLYVTMLECFFMPLYIWLEDLKNCTINILRNKRASAKLPKHIFDELARCFLPDIQAFYETVEGREEYEKWKRAQTQQTPQNAPQSP